MEEEHENETGPQLPAQAVEMVAEHIGDWTWRLSDNIADLRRYIEASGMTVQEFMHLNLYKKNVYKVPWLKELGKKEEGA